MSNQFKFPYSDQSGSSHVKKLQNNAINNVALVIHKTNPKYDLNSKTDALCRVRAGGYVVPNNCHKPHSSTPIFSKAPVVPKNNKDVLAQKIALCNIRGGGCNANWCS
jgi:hypothetical protein